MTLKFEIVFSYNQFLVFDKSVPMPGCIWTDSHVKQGFARRDSMVCFGTILEFGKAFLNVYFEPYKESKNHQRVITTPFSSPSGVVLIEGPEERNTSHSIRLEPGNYNLTAAQQVKGDIEDIDLYFDKVIEPCKHSNIVIADEDLDPPAELVEQAEIAEV